MNTKPRCYILRHAPDKNALVWCQVSKGTAWTLLQMFVSQLQTKDDLVEFNLSGFLEENLDDEHFSELTAKSQFNAGLEAAAKLMEENAADWRGAGSNREMAWQLESEARHIRELKK